MVTKVICTRSADTHYLTALATATEKKEGCYLVIIGEAPFSPIPTSAKVQYFPSSEENLPFLFQQLAHQFLFTSLSVEGRGLELLQTIWQETALSFSEIGDQGVQIINNLSHTLSHSLVSGEALYGAYKNIPAFICGGGHSITSLDLASLPEKGLLFAAGSGTEYLCKKKIPVDLAAHVDPYPTHRFSKHPYPLACSLRTSKEGLCSSTKEKVLFPVSGKIPLEEYLQKQLGLTSFPADGGWSSLTWLTSIVYSLGCNPIVFLGVDLFSSSKMLYPKEISYTKKEDLLIPTTSLKGIQGFSKPDWILAKNWLEQFLLSHPERVWINSSEGLPIQGTTQISFSSLSLPSLKHPIRLSLPATPLPTHKVRETLVLAAKKNLEIVLAILKEMEKIYPAFESGSLSLLLSDLEESWLYQELLEPLWSYWKATLERENRAGAPGLFLHKILFFRSTLDTLCRSSTS